MGMENWSIEKYYPISFRKNDANILGKHLANRHSVVLIGMKRVGISNFLRFFLYHKDIAKTYIKDGENHLFIPVDLNDLVEREVSPFWTLTLKRIMDAVEKSAIKQEFKKQIETLFLDSIQSQDLFLTIDSVRQALIKIVDAGFLPTIFFVRFDRMKDVVTHEFFANLQGLKDASHRKLSYVFTSVRNLNELSPSVFPKASLSVFSHDMYIEPAKEDDVREIFQTSKKHYKLRISAQTEKKLFNLIDGYIQYFQLALIILNEKREIKINAKTVLFDLLIKDERINLQSEELWESLTKDEQQVLLKIIRGEGISADFKKNAKYIWDTGFISKKGNNNDIFSPLFEYYVRKMDKKELLESSLIEFTKKENLLFNFLKQYNNEICEREKIIEAVWPEVEELGVTDWAIDRLVARVRSKLKLLKSKYEIQTVKTRGYKLIEAAS